MIHSVKGLMREKINQGDCIDVSNFPMRDGEYILPDDLVIGDRDLCVLETGQWIWSVGKHKETGERLASLSATFYRPGDDSFPYECIWLR